MLLEFHHRGGRFPTPDLWVTKFTISLTRACIFSCLRMPLACGRRPAFAAVWGMDWATVRPCVLFMNLGCIPQGSPKKKCTHTGSCIAFPPCNYEAPFTAHALRASVNWSEAGDIARVSPSRNGAAARHSFTASSLKLGSTVLLEERATRPRPKGVL